MSVPGYPGTAGLPAAPEETLAWVVGGATIVSFVVLLWIIELFDNLSGHRLDSNGIRPLETDGLGVLVAPLLHSNWERLSIANTGPALVLGFLMTLAGLSRFIFATAIIWILGGLGTWLIGNVGAPTYNGMVVNQPHRRFRADFRVADLPHRFRLLHPQGLGDRRRGGRAVHLRQHPVLGVLPGTFGVSWQGHLCGAIAGVLAAYLLSGPERKTRALRRPVRPPSLGA